jgi:glycine/D-amino acid oxidase-like deaminating enzyme/nitrite reductase/ring-hydroxylating ferredoxin subunit
MAHKPYWNVGPNLPIFPRLEEDLKAEVVVVGGGITGVTAAYLLKKAGLGVTLLERDHCGGADTGHTTAHLTCVTDLRLHKLAGRFGRDHSQAAWEAGRAAMDQIDQIVRDEGLDCDFARAPGYLHAPIGEEAGDEREGLRKDADLGLELGFEAEFLESVPFAGTPGVRFPNQAKFHPLKYLAGLLERIPGKKCHVFERTEVTEVEGAPLVVKANSHLVRCDYAVIATHVPLVGKAGLVSAALFQSKLASYTSYAIGAKVKRGTVPEALFWDTASPYHYLRADRHPRHDYVILGGEDHKSGQESDPESLFRELERRLKSKLPEAKLTYRWSGQVVETNDGLPLIGETSERQFAATGFAGNGMTFGTLAAIMACDAAQGKKNPWRDLFDVHRKKLSSTWDYIRENLDYPYYMIRDRLSSTEGTTTRSLKAGAGKVLTLKGRRVAAYRDTKGDVVTLSPACTHLGCLVSWNAAESTWDCPCHGSRFKPTGQVLAGPAESPLESVSLDEAE